MFDLSRLKLPPLWTVNRALTVVVAGLALYIMLVPFLPEMTWWVRHDSPAKVVAAPVSVAPVANGQKKPTIAGDVLVIPGIDMQETIHEGGLTTLRLGVWRLPYTSTPDKGGNTVLVGHRFTYVNPQGVFYYLDKVQVGDPISIYWEGKLYQYKVTSTKVVPPTDLSVEANTSTSELTLYTCTPLWTSTNRLVIVAELQKGAA